MWYQKAKNYSKHLKQKSYLQPNSSNLKQFQAKNKKDFKEKHVKGIKIFLKTKKVKYSVKCIKISLKKKRKLALIISLMQ